MRIIIVLTLFLLVSCFSKNTFIDDQLMKKSVIISDTVNYDCKKDFKSIRSNFIPQKRDVLKLENIINKLYYGYRDSYKQYRGYVDRSGDTIIQIALLTECGVKKFKTWRKEPFEFIMNHDHKRNNKMFNKYLYFKKKREIWILKPDAD